MRNRWESDFRYPAMQASMIVAEHCAEADVFDITSSFCLPVSEKPVVSWVTPGRITLMFLILGLAGLICGAIISSQIDEGNPLNGVWLSLAACSSLSGFCCFFIPMLVQKHIIKWCIGDRGKALANKSSGNDLIYCELGDSSNPHLTIDGDDFIVMLLDRANQRLLIEGVGASYQIRGDDIVSIQEFQFMGCMGADIVYRIDPGTCLRVGIAKANGLKELRNQMPFLVFVDRWIKNQILDEVLDTLGVPLCEWDADEEAN